MASMIGLHIIDNLCRYDPHIADTQTLRHQHAQRAECAQKQVVELERQLQRAREDAQNSMLIVHESDRIITSHRRILEVRWKDAAARYGLAWQDFSYIAILPSDVLLHILSFVGCGGLCTLMGTSKLLRSAALHDSIWKDLFFSAQEMNVVNAKGGNKLVYQLLRDAHFLESQKKRASYAGNGANSWFENFKEKSTIEKNWKSHNCQVKTLSGHTGDIICLQFEKDVLVSGGGDCSLRLWDLNSYKCKRVLAEHTRDVFCLQFSDGKIYSGSGDRTIKVWDAETGQCVRTFAGHTKSVSCLQADRTRLVSGCAEGKILTWDLNSGKVIDTLQSHNGLVWCLQFQGPHLVAGGSDNQILKLWDMSTKRVVRSFDGHKDWVSCLQFEGNLLASGSRDSTVRMWDMNTGQCLNVLDGHSAIVYTLQFNSSRLLSGCDDNIIRWWDMGSGTCYKTFMGTHHDAILSMQFTDDRLVTGSYDQTIDVYDFSA